MADRFYLDQDDDSPNERCTMRKYLFGLVAGVCLSGSGFVRAFPLLGTESGGSDIVKRVGPPLGPQHGLKAKGE